MAQWYYKIAEQVVGPLTADQLKALAAGGRLAPNDPVAQSPAGPWVAAARVKGLFAIAEIDDEPEPGLAQIPPVLTRPAAGPPIAPENAPPRRAVEPPILPPPVVMSGPGPPRGAPATSPTPSPRGQTAPSGPLAGFALQTDEVGATSRFQKKAKKEREPLTKAQKNARLVAWLAVAFVLSAVVLASIPYLRAQMRPKAEPAAARAPVLRDVDIVPSATGLDDAFRTPSGAAGHGSEAALPAAQPPASAGAAGGMADRPGAPSREEPMVSEEGPVEVKPVRVALDRPKMSGSSGQSARPVNRLLVVELELRMKGPAPAVRFQGFSGFAKEISLTDDRGVVYEVRTPESFHHMFVEGQCREPVFLSAKEPIHDAVIFAWPEKNAPTLPSSGDEALKLRLPKMAYGERGELRFEIPLSGIEVAADGDKAAGTRPADEKDTAPTTRAANEKDAGPATRPEGQKETTPDGGQPVDDGGPIPIPGLR